MAIGPSNKEPRIIGRLRNSATKALCEARDKLANPVYANRTGAYISYTTPSHSTPNPVTYNDLCGGVKKLQAQSEIVRKEPPKAATQKIETESICPNACQVMFRWDICSGFVASPVFLIPLN